MEFSAVELIHFLQQSELLLEELLTEASHYWQISSAEARILLFLACAPHLDTARDVAVHCGMSKASVSGNVLKLTTRGLLTIDVDLKDRRFQHLTPTEQSAPVLESIRNKVSQFTDHILAPLLPEERTQFLHMLARLNSGAAENNTTTTVKEGTL